MSIIALSHVLSGTTPLYGKTGAIRIDVCRSIAAGDTSNNSEISLPAHAGTHIDAPFHFDRNGWTLDQYPPDFWICTHPFVLQKRVEPAEIIRLADWQDALESIPVAADLLLLKTGFEDYRGKVEYATHGPGIAPDVGLWLRRNRRLRMIGFDFISLSCFQERQLGREAHRAFLEAEPEGAGEIGEPLLIIEDMRLSDLDGVPKEVVVAPLVFENADGAPVSVIAKM